MLPKLQLLTFKNHTPMYLLYIFSGDYRDCTIVVWSTDSYGILTTSKAASPIHSLKWDPYTVNEFASVGQNGTVLFWLLDETTTNICLNVHDAEVPDDLLRLKHGVILRSTYMSDV